MRKIAIEEHFFTQEYVDYMYSRKEFPRWEIVEENDRKIERRWNFLPDAPVVYPVAEKPDPDRPSLTARLLDVGEGRLRDMDSAGIDTAVLSLSIPGVEAFEAVEGTTCAKKTNDELARIVKKQPKRFAGFAALAPQDPIEAANELRRAVKELGLKGAMINSHVRGEYLDDRKFWPIFETAEKLGVPIYIHPRWPSPGMVTPYLDYPGLVASMWGFGVEVSLHSLRLIFSGVFDEYPGLKIIIGHLGEALPFWLWRIDNRYPIDFLRDRDRKVKLKRKPGDYFKENFCVTTSGMYSQPPFMCTYLVLGADNIMFAGDYPYEADYRVAVQFMDSLSICDSDKEKIFRLNAEKLLRL